MVDNYRKNDVSNNLIAGLLVFLTFFIGGLAYWDWHHEQEILRNLHIQRPFPFPEPGLTVTSQ
ncbi:hypothetical protein HYY75_11800 [bacterium]|nr:hypothetical protein [bacterium]